MHLPRFAHYRNVALKFFQVIGKILQFFRILKRVLVRQVELEEGVLVEWRRGRQRRGPIQAEIVGDPLAISATQIVQHLN